MNFSLWINNFLDCICLSLSLLDIRFLAASIYFIIPTPFRVCVDLMNNYNLYNTQEIDGSTRVTFFLTTHLRTDESCVDVAWLLQCRVFGRLRQIHLRRCSPQEAVNAGGSVNLRQLLNDFLSPNPVCLVFKKHFQSG